MTDRELMQMALDALEAQFYTDGRAIKALRDRLAQPEQESAIPAGVISAIRNAGLTLVRTQQGYVLQRIEGIKAQPEPYKQPEDNRLLMKAYRAIQEKQPESEPVAIGEEWKPCVKLPIVVHVREQRKGETHVSTREGITPVKEDDLIMRGVAGEEYPIGRELFNSTYTFDTAPPKREWVGLVEQDVHDAFQFTEFIKQLSFDRERPEWCENFAAYIEAKLKDKNT